MSVADEDKLEVYELQLVQLEGQLETAMIENQALSRELGQLKGRGGSEEMSRELSALRREKTDLLNELRRRRTSGVDMSDYVDLSQDAQDLRREGGDTPTLDDRKTRMSRVTEWSVQTLYTILEDFNTEADDQIEDVPEEQLSMKQLKDSIRRFKRETKPVLDVLRGLRAVLSWKQPAFTLLAFVIYLYAVWHGWMLSMVFFLLFVRLFINFLKFRCGMNVSMHFLRHKEDFMKVEDDKEYGISGKINVVLQVAKNVQNKLNQISRGIEKIKNFLTWQTPEQTKKLLIGLSVACLASCLLPGEVLTVLLGLLLGIKLFITDNIYKRFPRLKRKYDSMNIMWNNMVTDEELFKLKARHKARLNSLGLPVTLSQGSTSVGEPSNFEAPQSAEENKSKEAASIFQKLFHMPEAEYPMKGWDGGRSCSVMDQSKSLLSAFTYGRLYLSKSFLCFAASKEESENVIIPLKDVTKVKKAKPFGWMPGKGMAIEVTVLHQEKPYIFGGLLRREDTYNSILTVGSVNSLPWAVLFGQHPPGHTPKVRMSELKKKH